ncbi:hypothetical protein CONLIGDRAFT_464480 [Coniochaeta ligniaria NRRL 30616]|uniref:Uncharacterized protein n=1 Tax=Coniochaeta ligniaria NRRL 30616 TaxID=1408157 RepID=A0A1J7JEM5_9PEZI|nr:hypothetical protein CONLIGDRAFT_464480 [Coniochaeta ligniaria NRRL 30616]
MSVQSVLISENLCTSAIQAVRCPTFSPKALWQRPIAVLREENINIQAKLPSHLGLTGAITAPICTPPLSVGPLQASRLVPEAAKQTVPSFQLHTDSMGSDTLAQKRPLVQCQCIDDEWLPEDRLDRQVPSKLTILSYSHRRYYEGTKVDQRSQHSGTMEVVEVRHHQKPCGAMRILNLPLTPVRCDHR